MQEVKVEGPLMHFYAVKIYGAFDICCEPGPMLFTLVFLLNEHAHSNKYFVIFQPTCPFLLHKNEQGGHSYLIPCSFIRTCSFNRKTRVVCKMPFGH